MKHTCLVLLLLCGLLVLTTSRKLEDAEADKKECPDGCDTHGKCNDETKECECSDGWEGEACKVQSWEACYEETTTGTLSHFMLCVGEVPEDETPELSLGSIKRFWESVQVYIQPDYDKIKSDYQAAQNEDKEPLGKEEFSSYLTARCNEWDEDEDKGVSADELYNVLKKNGWDGKVKDVNEWVEKAGGSAETAFTCDLSGTSFHQLLSVMVLAASKETFFPLHVCGGYDANFNGALDKLELKTFLFRNDIEDPENAEQIIQVADKNNNNEIDRTECDGIDEYLNSKYKSTEEDVVDWEEIFNEIDANDDDCIDVSEFWKALYERASNEDIFASDVYAFYKDNDITGNRCIALWEFERMVYVEPEVLRRLS
eukprot:GFYU01003680.1.p2 GENE.GFYU01003680.1~~GFYU01003680.1.p2  ORF type:complete len:371 (-),score=130.83 GFYU01003680.1:2035-3147(-)